VQTLPQQATPSQSAVVVQLALHAVAPHTYGAQEVVAPATHEPAPLQVAAAVLVAPRHDAEPQRVPDGQFRHAPALQLPSVPHVEAALTAQTPRGSAIPFVAVAHVPFVPLVSAAEHAWQAVLHAVSQQKPSTQ
jgi:hypothetical protein